MSPAAQSPGTSAYSSSSTVIPSLSLGLSLSSPYLAPDRLDAFMRRMLVSRISRRVLAEHHIALSKDHRARREGSYTPADHVGVIYTGLNVRESIERCASYLRSREFNVDLDMPPASNTSAEWSEVVVDGHTDTQFPYIKEHLECVWPPSLTCAPLTEPASPVISFLNC